MNDAIAWISLFVGISSLALAGFTIWFARSTERETREQFEKTKDLLAEIDKRASAIEQTVNQSQKEMLGTMTRIIDETVIPKKQDVGEQFAAMFMQSFFQDPKQGVETLAALKPLIELGQASKQHERTD